MSTFQDRWLEFLRLKTGGTYPNARNEIRLMQEHLGIEIDMIHKVLIDLDTRLNNANSEH